MRIISLFCVFLLIGCSSVPTSTVTPTQPTATSPAAVTPIKSTVTTTPTPDFYATNFWITSTAVVNAILTAEPGRVYKSYLSPDRKWKAEIRVYDCVQVNTATDADENAYDQLKVMEVNSKEEHVADSQLQNCGGLGAAGLEGLYWSSNSQSFYYTDARVGIPDGCGYWEKPVLLWDVNTLQTEELGAGPLSPDQRKIATWQGKEIVIWDINMGAEIGRISPDILNAEMWTGPIVWSPDSQAFVYLQPESFCPLSGNSRVVRVDLPTLKQTTLLESQAPTFGSAHWDKLNELRLFDENGKQWTYDFRTQKLRPLQ